MPMIKLLKMLKPHRLTVALILILTLLQTLSELSLPTLMAEIVNHGVLEGRYDIIRSTGLKMLMVAFAGTICAILVALMASRTATTFGRDLRHRIFHCSTAFSLAELDRIGTSSLITRTTSDVTQVQMVVQMMLRMFVSAPLMCIGGIIMAVSKDSSLAMIIVVVMPLLALVFFGVSQKSMPLFRQVQSRLDHLTSVIRENLTGLRVIRAFDKSETERERFLGANKDLTDTSIQVSRLMAVTMPAMLLMLNFSLIATIWAGSLRIDQGSLQVGDLMAFIQYIMQIMFSFMMVALMFVVIPRAMVSAGRIDEVLGTNTAIQDPSLAEDETAFFTKESGTSAVRVAFENVSFSYPGAETPALSDISFVAEPGKKTAIIGGTGSGKSTLLSLIPRFYDVNEGCVTVGGVDVRRIRLAALRGSTGYVPQRSSLLNGSLADNLLFGKPDATEIEMRVAATDAQAMEFIEQFEEGFDAFVAQGGRNLSGGQKQRVAVARALIRQPALYLLDDCLSALDMKTDAELRRALRKRGESTTVIQVAQRVSSILDADQILVLEEGRLVGKGTHQELMTSCLIYREIVASQALEVEAHE